MRRINNLFTFLFHRPLKRELAWQCVRVAAVFYFLFADAAWKVRPSQERFITGTQAQRKQTCINDLDERWVAFAARWCIGEGARAVAERRRRLWTERTSGVRCPLRCGNDGRQKLQCAHIHALPSCFNRQACIRRLPQSRSQPVSQPPSADIPACITTKSHVILSH